jgi:hypothetical protein
MPGQQGQITDWERKKMHFAFQDLISKQAGLTNELSHTLNRLWRRVPQGFAGHALEESVQRFSTGRDWSRNELGAFLRTNEDVLRDVHMQELAKRARNFAQERRTIMSDPQYDTQELETGLQNSKVKQDRSDFELEILQRNELRDARLRLVDNKEIGDEEALRDFEALVTLAKGNNIPPGVLPNLQRKLSEFSQDAHTFTTMPAFHEMSERVSHIPALNPDLYIPNQDLGELSLGEVQQIREALPPVATGWRLRERFSNFVSGRPRRFATNEQIDAWKEGRDPETGNELAPNSRGGKYFSEWTVLQQQPAIVDDQVAVAQLNAQEMQANADHPEPAPVAPVPALSGQDDVIEEAHPAADVEAAEAFVAEGQDENLVPASPLVMAAGVPNELVVKGESVGAAVDHA